MKKLVSISLFIFFALVVAIFAAALLSYQTNKTGAPLAASGNNNPTVGAAVSASLATTVAKSGGSLTLNMAEVAKHNSASDCWMVISGKVYDVTSFLNSHPGGSGTMLPYCGQEATQGQGQGQSPGDKSGPGSKPGKGKGKGGGESEKGIPVITDIGSLTPEQLEAIRKRFEDMQELDKHLKKNTSEGASNSDEEMLKEKQRINEVRKKARAIEEARNNGRGLGKSWGRDEEIMILHKGEIDWKQRLRNFFKPWISKVPVPSFRALNRRDQTIYSGGMGPTVRPGTINPTNPNKLRIITTVDTSGSVDKDMLASFMSEIKKIFTDTVCKDANIEVRVIKWNGGISDSEDKLLNDKTFASFFNTVSRGSSGGTDFAQIKPWITKKNYKPVAVVHFTDGDMDISKDMLYTSNGCKNIIVIPRGYTSTINKCKEIFGAGYVIPMTIYQEETN